MQFFNILHSPISFSGYVTMDSHIFFITLFSKYVMFVLCLMP